jgi:hypothetical protein
MRLHAVRKDLEDGRLSLLPIEDVPPDGLILPMSVVWQTKSPEGRSHAQSHEPGQR